MKRRYYKDRAEYIQLFNKIKSPELLTHDKLKHLPKAIQKYFHLCGFVGKPIAMNADVIWGESFIKLKPNQKWRALNTLQFNSVHPIMRTSYMQVKKMFFAGKDLYKNGQGSMKGKILNLFTVINAEGRELSQSALITSFAEFLLLSGYACQDNIQWEEIDEQTVGATLTDHNFVVHGIFRFDSEGKWVSFESMDRYFNKGNGQYEKKKITAQIASYKNNGDYAIPHEVSISWWLENGAYEYFKGKIERIDYNVTR